MSSPSHDRDTVGATRRLRRRKATVWLTFFSFPLVVGVPIVLFGDAGPSPFITFGIWAIAVFAVACVSWLTKCPHCQRQFHMSDNLVSNPWTRQCMKCGFRL